MGKGLGGKKLTEREKAAIYMHIYGNCNEWTELYKIAFPGDPDEVKIESLSDLASKWKRSDKIQKFVQELTEQKAVERHKAKEEGRQEERRGESERQQAETKKPNPPKIDYNDPKERKNLYNRIIAEAADDPKTQLDAAKLIEQTQREDKQAAKDNKIQRFYTPVTCKDCAIYLKALKAKIKHE